MIHVGDVGTKIRIEFDQNTNIIEAISSTIKCKKPSGTRETWTASVVDNGLEYTTVDGDINESGEWELQGFVDLGTWSGSTGVIKLQVLPSI